MRIDDLGLLSDCRTAALVDRDGTVAWFSPRRFDGASIFGRLLDPDAGHWTIRPRTAYERVRRYRGDAPILETAFRCTDGDVTLTDALELAHGTRGHRIMGSDSTHLVRRATCTSGRVELEVELVARPEYGLAHPHLLQTGTGWELIGGRANLQLVTDAPLSVEDDRLRGTVHLEAGESASFVLVAGTWDGRDAESALLDTAAGWESWAEPHGLIPGPHAADARRSAMVLQALTYAPSGVVVAAATTSLPERIGEGWNWDYRYAWLRDLAFVVRALWVAACPDEPQRYFDWVARALGRLDGEHVPIMFGLDGERDLHERTLPHLAGFRDSRPVRVGNDAWQQRQLDVPGEVIDSAHLMRDYLPERIDGPIGATLVALADRAAATWREPDAGMWEARDRERQYTSSKVMAWVALDRAVQLAPRLGREDRASRWARERDAVRRAVLEEAWDPDVRAFTGAIGSDRLDASVLLMPLVGIVEGDDARMRSTIERIEDELATPRGVQRWADEGSGFVLCGFWLAECLALARHRERAEERYASTADCANDLGLMAEEVDLETGEPLGNTPQALSHVGQINAAWRLVEGESADV